MQDYSDHEVIAFIVQQLAKDYPKPPVPAEAVDAAGRGVARERHVRPARRGVGKHRAPREDQGHHHHGPRARP